MRFFKKLEHKYSRFSLAVSFLLHAVVFILLFRMPEASSAGYGNNIEVELGGMGGAPGDMGGEPVKSMDEEETNKDEQIEDLTEETVNTKDKSDIKPNEKPGENTVKKSNSESLSNTTNIKKQTGTKGSKGGLYNGYSYGAGDTSSLTNVYKEKTLNVTINYPRGWTFIDQNVKNKLDGVTFWMESGNIKPPPYVHLDVQNKDLFDPRRFDFNEEARNCVIYFNDPEEMSGQISQTFYLRTRENEDYSIKLIVKGRGEFKAFQTIFFGMLKTFKFGNRFF